MRRVLTWTVLAILVIVGLYCAARYGSAPHTYPSGCPSPRTMTRYGCIG